ncbi:hypothetical protein HYDPIDRAFT_165322 [Hydnomerulius pinastri MD-312]|nr:hypothetical protein HYDPIDRAFT_165322 [Hydnomerulius pinastri MD-312]
MSDATGFGSGGTSDLLTVGDSVSGNSCNTSVPAVAFAFSLPSSLSQCNPYVFDSYNGAILPVTITGLIPGGEAFVLHPGATATSYTWTANVAAGTTIIFTMIDAQGRSGGSSDTEVVLLSNDATCLNGNSPSSTATVAPSSTSTSHTTTSTTPTQTSSSSSGVSIGAIAGTAAGAVVAIAALVTLALFCIKKRREKRSPYGLAAARSSRRLNSVDLDAGPDTFSHAPIYPFPYQTDSAGHFAPPVAPGSAVGSSFLAETASVHASVQPDPFAFPASPATQTQHSRGNSNTDSFGGFGEAASSSMSSSGRRKAAMAGLSGYQTPTRFIVHTDAEDAVPPDSTGLVELPPQYTERRAPPSVLPQDRPMSSATQYTSTDLAYAPGSYLDEPPQSTPHPPPLR